MADEDSRELVTVKHPGIEGTAQTLRSALPHLDGEWEPVDEPDDSPSPAEADQELVWVRHPDLEGPAAQTPRSALAHMDGKWVEVPDPDTVPETVTENLQKSVLQAVAKSRGLPVSGTKAELAEAITAHDEETAQDSPPADGDVATPEEK
jgi:hypothetical protein